MKAGKDFIDEQVGGVKKELLQALGFGWLLPLGMIITRIISPDWLIIISGITINSWVTIGIFGIIMLGATVWVLFKMLQGKKGFFVVHSQYLTSEDARVVINEEASQVLADVKLAPSKDNDSRIMILPSFWLMIGMKVEAIPRADVDRIEVKLEKWRVTRGMDTKLHYQIFTKHGMHTMHVLGGRSELENQGRDVLAKLTPHITSVFQVEQT